MTKYIEIHEPRKWKNIKGGCANAIPVFLTTNPIPDKEQIPVYYVDAFFDTKKKYEHGNFIEETSKRGIESVYNYADLAYRAEDWEDDILIINDTCLLFDTLFLKRFKESHPGLRLAYRIHLPFREPKRENSFFIRPEDLHLYEDVFDIIIFNSVETYNIYADESYPLDINSIIFFRDGVPTVNNKMLDPKFAQRRLTCKGRCWQGAGCKLCAREFAAAALSEEYFKK